MGRSEHAAAKGDLQQRLGIAAPAPNPERIETIREWLASKAVSPEDPVAGLAMTISATGRIDVAMRGIEVEFVDQMVEEMTDLIGALTLWKDAKAKPFVRADNVVKLTRFNIE
jgi:hypothetical protein